MEDEAKADSLRRMLEAAIRWGAPLYNAGREESCYLVYRAAVTTALASGLEYEQQQGLHDILASAPAPNRCPTPQHGPCASARPADRAAFPV